MLIASLLHRVGVLVLQLQTISLRLGRPDREARRRPPLSTAPAPFWPADEGEPTWEDAEWQ